MDTILSYVPMDRRHALARASVLPDRTEGAALFADISGFTPLNEALTQTVGPQRGAEELISVLNRLYDALVAEVDRYRGSVISFSGDALTAWFDADNGRRAVAGSLAMQMAMGAFRAISIHGGRTVALALKVAVATGPARRFLVGDPNIHCLEVLAGKTLAQLAATEHLAQPGEIILSPNASNRLRDQVGVADWRSTEDDAEKCAVVNRLLTVVNPQPWLPLSNRALPDERVRPWLLPPVYTRLQSGGGEFLTELRPTVSFFLKFGELDYDRDDDAGQKLDAFIRWIQINLEKYEGALLQLTFGDKGSYLYASFGAPIAHGDDIARAAGAAMELRRLPAKLSYIGNAQIGISAGLSRAGSYGGSTRTYGVIGEATNLAARLMQAAAPGEVLMSAPLAPSISRRFFLEPLPPIELKGKKQPAAIVAITGLRPAPEIRLQEPQYAMPMIGRTAELAMVEEKIALARRGQGQIVGITAEAGMGKSRLVAEAIGRATAAGLVGFGGEAQSTGTQISYLAWQSIWRAFFELDALATFDEQVERVEREVSNLDPMLIPRLPLLQQVLNLPIPGNDLTRSMDARLRKESLEGMFVEILRARAARSPLLLVLEDAHWLDALSVDLLSAIGRALSRMPVILVTAFRPLEGERGVHLPITDLLHTTLIHLSTFTPAEAAQMIEHKLAQTFGPQTQVPASFVQAIIERAGGNPFFLEELLNYLQDRGISPNDRAAFERLDLPSSLASLILSRIDQLTHNQQMTIKVASAIGRVFRFGWLSETHPGLGPQEQVLQDLEVLARLELTPLDTPEPELTYLFKHAMTQQVVYDTMPFAMREQLHEQLASWLETQPSPVASVDLLTFHYGRSANTAKQIEYFQKAGDAAAARYANAAAIYYYERLLELLEFQEKGLIYIALAQVLVLTGAWDAAEARYRAALDVDLGAEYARVRAQAMLGIGALYRLRARFDDAIMWIGKARREFEALGDQASVSSALLEMAHVYWWQKNLDLTEEFVNASMTLEGESGDKVRTARAMMLFGNAALSKRDWETTSDYFHKCRELYRAVGNKQGVATATTNLALTAFEQGRYEQARSFLAESLSLFHELGARREYGRSSQLQAWVFKMLGDTASARALHSANLALFRDLGARVEILEGLVGLMAATDLTDSDPDASRYAVRLAGAATKLTESLAREMEPTLQGHIDRVIAVARQEFGEPFADAAWAEGYALDWNQAVEYALTRNLS